MERLVLTPELRIPTTRGDKWALWMLLGMSAVRIAGYALTDWGNGHVVMATVEGTALVVSGPIMCAVVSGVVKKLEAWDRYLENIQVLDAVGRAMERGGY